MFMEAATPVAASTDRAGSSSLRGGVLASLRPKSLFASILSDDPGNERSVRVDTYQLSSCEPARWLASSCCDADLHLDDLFVVGRSHRANAIRIFKVSRILAARATNNRCERPEDFDLERIFQGSFGIIQTNREPVEISVQFKGVAAAVVEERIWHDSQKLEWLPAEADLFDHEPDKEDSLVATFKLAEVIEFKRWLDELYGDDLTKCPRRRYSTSGSLPGGCWSA